MMQPSHRWQLALLLITFVVLASIYSVVIPLGEAPDEVSHFQYIQQLRERQRLPTMDDGSGEIHQPPLYYVLGAVLTAWIPDAQFTILANPDWQLNNPDTPNLLLHTRQEQFPFEKGALVWHLLRLFSVALGTITVWATYQLVLEFFPGNHWGALAAAAFLGFIPGFTFLSAVFNNDNLVIALSTLITLVFLRTASGTRAIVLFALGLLLGFAALAKVSVLALCPPLGLAMLLGWHKGWRGNRLVSIALVFGVALIVVSPWFVYNTIVFGDPLNSAYMQVYSTPRTTPVTLMDWNIYVTRMWESFWGKFGGAVSLVMPGATYWALTSVVALGFLGAFVQFRDWRAGRLALPTKIGWAIFILFFVLLVGAQIRFMLQMYGMDEARHIYASLPLFSIFTVAGVLRLVQSRQNLAAIILTIGMGLLGIGALYFAASIYAPRYSAPAIASSLVPIDFGGQIRVVNYRIDQTQVAPNESISVQINWQVLRDGTENDWLMLQLVSANDVIAQQEGVPSNGRTTTDWWRAGQTLSSRHVLVVPAEIGAGKYQVRLGLHPFGRWEWLPVRGGEFYTLGTIEVR